MVATCVSVCGSKKCVAKRQGWKALQSAIYHWELTAWLRTLGLSVLVLQLTIHPRVCVIGLAVSNLQLPQHSTKTREGKFFHEENQASCHSMLVDLYCIQPLFFSDCQQVQRTFHMLYSPGSSMHGLWKQLLEELLESWSCLEAFTFQLCSNGHY